MVCTLCLCIRGGTQECNWDLHCPYPSQGLSAEFGEKKIPCSQTQVSGFKYKSTKEGSCVGKSFSCSDQSFFRKTLHSLLCQDAEFSWAVSCPVSSAMRCSGQRYVCFLKIFWLTGVHDLSVFCATVLHKLIISVTGASTFASGLYKLCVSVFI